MAAKSTISKILNWLANTEMFANPSKQLPGKWVLTEYYFEPEGELIHINEEKFKAEKLFWKLEFKKNDIFIHETNLKVPLILKIEEGSWSRSKNFITLIHSKDFRNNVEFQFAIEKGMLKLLRKDAVGRIEFFGFFKKEIVIVNTKK